jgi:hypothetical protein
MLSLALPRPLSPAATSSRRLEPILTPPLFSFKRPAEDYAYGSVLHHPIPSIPFYGSIPIIAKPMLPDLEPLLPSIPKFHYPYLQAKDNLFGSIAELLHPSIPEFFKPSIPAFALAPKPLYASIPKAYPSIPYYPHPPVAEVSVPLPYFPKPPIETVAVPIPYFKPSIAEVAVPLPDISYHAPAPKSWEGYLPKIFQAQQQPQQAAATGGLPAIPGLPSALDLIARTNAGVAQLQSLLKLNTQNGSK